MWTEYSLRTPPRANRANSLAFSMRAANEDAKGASKGVDMDIPIRK